MWRIYYADGTTYEGAEGPPTGDRARHVQAILQDDAFVGVAAVTQCSAYGHRDGEWVGLDWFDVWDFLLDSGIIVFGSTVRREEYEAIMERVRAEKHGWLPREVKAG